MLFNKGQNWTFSQVMGLLLIILVVLILLGIIPIFGKNAANSVSCSSKNGVCRDKCEPLELPWYADVNRTCEEKGRTCCLPRPGAIQGTVASKECNGKTSGQSCGNEQGASYVCNEQLQCITKCEFCGTHSTNALCVKSLSGVDFNENFICGCTEAECKDLRPNRCTKAGAPGFCYSIAYCCEK